MTRTTNELLKASAIELIQKLLAAEKVDTVLLRTPDPDRIILAGDKEAIVHLLRQDIEASGKPSLREAISAYVVTGAQRFWTMRQPNGMPGHTGITKPPADFPGADRFVEFECTPAAALDQEREASASRIAALEAEVAALQAAPVVAASDEPSQHDLEQLQAKLDALLDYPEGSVGAAMEAACFYSWREAHVNRPGWDDSDLFIYQKGLHDGKLASSQAAAPAASVAVPADVHALAVRYCEDWDDHGKRFQFTFTSDQLEAFVEALAATPSAQAQQPAGAPAELARIGELLRTQDNRYTDQPMFTVQQRRRITGLDPDYCENIVWLHSEGDFDEAEPEKAASLEAEYQDSGKVPSGWMRTGYVDQWEFVTACFTEQGCKDYLAINGHNLKEPRIYADGSYRNNEYRAVRDWLMSLPPAPGLMEAE